MIPALVRLYDRLVQAKSPHMPPIGFRTQSVGFVVVLERDGRLRQIRSAGNASSGQETHGRVRTRPTRPMHVPDTGQRTSNAGTTPYLLCDKADFLLGWSGKGGDRQAASLRRVASRQYHLRLLGEIADESIQAVVQFFKRDDPSVLDMVRDSADLLGGFGVFQLTGTEQPFAHEVPSFVEWWSEKSAQAQACTVPMPNLIDNRTVPCAVLHSPYITVTKPTGRRLASVRAPIVSFNQPAFDSYDKTKGKNAPVPAGDSSKYCKALGYLCTDHEHHVRIGVHTFVFWAEAATSSGIGLDRLLDPDEECRSIFAAIRDGREVNALPTLTSSFHCVTLAPLAKGRIAVREHRESRASDVIACFRALRADAALAGVRKGPNGNPEWHESTASWLDMVRSTARHSRGVLAEESADDTLAPGVLQAALAGGRLPRRLLTRCIDRVVRELDFGACRAHTIRAFLRSHGDKDMDAYLNKLHPSQAYHCGRLLAVLGLAQRIALERSDATLIRRHLNSAMSQPAQCLPRLQGMAEVAYFPKLEGDIGAFVRDEVKSILCQLKDSWPGALAPMERGRFLLGFYQEEAWLDEVATFQRKEFGRLARLRTDRGEWVRSKGEQRVANLLNRLGVSYVYEVRALLQSGQERWPDFFVKGSSALADVYIEYLGMNTESYNARWQDKLRAYDLAGIRSDGGEAGRLVVLDYRTRQPSDPELLADLHMFNLLQTSDANSL